MLIVEPDSMVRRTVTGVARVLDIAEVRDASTYQAAEIMLFSARYAGLIIALSGDGAGEQLIEQVRSGKTRCAPECPVVVMTTHCDATRAESMRALNIKRVILKPFKVKTVLDSIARLATN